jgi:hypothetical protein
MTFKTKSPKINLIMMILSLCLLIATTSFLRLLSIKIPTPFLLRFFLVYHNLKYVFSTSLACWPVHLVSLTHKILTRLLIALSTNFLNLSIKDVAFQLPKRILLSPTSFLAPRTRQVKCEDPCSFDTTSGRRKSTKSFDPYSFDTTTLVHLPLALIELSAKTLEYYVLKEARTKKK